ncbi:WAS/WASL-interacting protein member 1 [Lobulomyces angularis]|nr:WAS/WASL-interacting protein member 1 [Lobulomyces angularis]
MPGPPPPPPPGAPPPPQNSGPIAAKPKNLLSQIEKGAKLKKTVTNDRSGAVIEPPKGQSVSSGNSPGQFKKPYNSGGQTSQTTQSSSPQLGGLFAGGIPKLKPTNSNLNNSGSARAKPSILPARPNNQSPVNISNAPPPPLRQPPPPPERTSPSFSRKEFNNSIGSKPPLAPARAIPAPPTKSNGPPLPARNSPKAAWEGNDIQNNNFVNGGNSSVNGKYEKIGRWNFRTDLPPPRIINGSSVESPRVSSTRKAPPPPPSRKVTNAENVKAIRKLSSKSKIHKRKQDSTSEKSRSSSAELSSSQRVTRSVNKIKSSVDFQSEWFCELCNEVTSLLLAECKKCDAPNPSLQIPCKDQFFTENDVKIPTAKKKRENSVDLLKEGEPGCDKLFKKKQTYNTDSAIVIESDSEIKERKNPKKLTKRRKDVKVRKENQSKKNYIEPVESSKMPICHQSVDLKSSEDFSKELKSAIENSFSHGNNPVSNLPEKKVASRNCVENKRTDNVESILDIKEINPVANDAELTEEFENSTFHSEIEQFISIYSKKSSFHKEIQNISKCFTQFFSDYDKMKGEEIKMRNTGLQLFEEAINKNLIIWKNKLNEKLINHVDELNKEQSHHYDAIKSEILSFANVVGAVSEEGLKVKDMCESLNSKLSSSLSEMLDLADILTCNFESFENQVLMEFNRNSQMMSEFRENLTGLRQRTGLLEKTVKDLSFNMQVKEESLRTLNENRLEYIKRSRNRKNNLEKQIEFLRCEENKLNLEESKLTLLGKRKRDGEEEVGGIKRTRFEQTSFNCSIKTIPVLFGFPLDIYHTIFSVSDSLICVNMFTSRVNAIFMLILVKLESEMSYLLTTKFIDAKKKIITKMVEIKTPEMVITTEAEDNAIEKGNSKETQKKLKYLNNLDNAQLLSVPGGVNTLVNKLLNKPNKIFQELRIEDLDENVIKQKLAALEEELAQYKEKCQRYKAENEWYINEIESCKNDTTEYIAFLEAKKEEKVSIISDLTERNRKQLQLFTEKKLKKELENQQKIESIKVQIEDLHFKLEQKQEEINHLSDIMVRRARHETQVSKIKKEMQDAEIKHKNRVSEIERKLLEGRMKCQKEAETRVHEMENAAHEKASRYLDVHTKTLEKENAQLDLELRKLIILSEEKLIKKEWLLKSNRDLTQELKIREDIVKLRLKKIVKCQKKQFQEQETTRNFKIKKKREEMIQMLLKIGVIKKDLVDNLLHSSQQNQNEKNLEFNRDATLSSDDSKLLSQHSTIINPTEFEKSVANKKNPQDNPYIIDGVDLMELLDLNEDDLSESDEL